jgi:GDP-4-dehydro-6-deoxy-D-mannose reductase
VDDVVSAYAVLLEDGRPDSTYNICSGTAHSVREIVQKIVAACGKNIHLVDAPAATTGVACYVGDNGRLRREFSWGPAHTLDQAVQSLAKSCTQAQATAA